MKRKQRKWSHTNTTKNSKTEKPLLETARGKVFRADIHPVTWYVLWFRLSNWKNQPVQSDWKGYFPVLDLRLFQGCWWNEMTRLSFTYTALKICGQNLSPDLSSGPGLEVWRYWVQWLGWLLPQVLAAHSAPFGICTYAWRAENNFWLNGSLLRIHRVSLKTLSHAVWHYIHNMFC